MRGSVKLRRKGSRNEPPTWSLIFDLGYETDPETGVRRRKQKWTTFRGTRQEAHAELAKLTGSVHGGTYVETSKVTLIEFLRDWLDKAVKPPLKRPETYRAYKSIIDTHISKAAIATLPLQRVRTSDLEAYYGTLTGAAASVSVHHAILHRALRQAVRDRLITVNPTVAVENRRRPSKTERAKHAQSCWSASEARSFLQTVKTATPQEGAYFLLALDTGARKSELDGLLWSDVDFDNCTVTIERQLDAAGAVPTFGPTKTDRARTVTLGAETVAALRAHKAAQATVKMRNRTTYADYNLVFAREADDLRTPGAQLGQPLDTLSRTRFQRLIRQAGVRRIKFHALRHTSATLLLQAGVPIAIVAHRLGHAKPTTTLDHYAHALPDRQGDAANALARVLHG
jgi:integrase